MKRSQPPRSVRFYRRAHTGSTCARQTVRERLVDLEELLSLTPREWRLLQHAAAGLSDKQIAVAVARSPRTVTTQMRSLRIRLRIRTRFQFGFYASQLMRRLAEQAVMTGDLSTGLRVDLERLRSTLASKVSEGASGCDQAAAASVTRGGR